MTDKEIIIDGIRLEDIKNLLYTGHKMAISTKTFEAIIEQLQRKEQECEELKSCLECNPNAKVIKTNIELARIDVEVSLELANKYKQALDKIEKVLWHYHNNLYTPKNPVADEIEKRILDIINEVKNELL